jgi:hypothetical protein
MAEHKSDVHVEFFTDAVKLEAKSLEKGRPIFEDREFVRIRFPGDKHRELVAPANQLSVRNPQDNSWLTYADRFPEHYAAFKRNQQYFGEGTPIDEAPFLSNAEKAELKAFNVHTLEALAGMPDANLSKFGMGARKMQDQAKAYISKANDSALETRLAAENAGLRDQLASLAAQVQELVAAKQPAAQVPAGPSPFQAMDADTIKAYIKDRTGQAPRGNPSHETLVRMADELNVSPAAAA